MGGHRPSYTPSEPSYQQPTSNFDSPPSITHDQSRSSSYEPPAINSYQEPSHEEPQSSGYQPYSGGYEPPTSGYVPYEPENEPDSPDEPRPKKKSFMDYECVFGSCSRCALGVFVG